MLLPWFEQIRILLIESEDSWQAIQYQVDQVFQKIYQEAKKRDPSFALEKCKAFLTGKRHSILEVLGEWCRLWNSYLPSLFKYFQFPGDFKTNNTLEHTFSVEKKALIARVGKGFVSHMIRTREEAYLRLTHCTQEDLNASWEIGISDALIQALRAELQQEIRSSTQQWCTMSREYCKFMGITCIMRMLRRSQKRHKNDRRLICGAMKKKNISKYIFI